MHAAALAPDTFVVLLVIALLVVGAVVVWLMSRTLGSWRAGLSGVDEGLLAREGRARPAEGEDDEALREEVRALVIAENGRRERRGEEPLEVEAETDRRLRELGVWI